MSSESELRAANNDGMDPYWKPEFKDVRPLSFKELENLFYSCKSLTDVFDKKPEDLEGDEFYRVTMHKKFWREIRDAVLAIESRR